MRLIRILVLLLSGFSGVVQGLELGAIQASSHLNEPLKAVVPVRGISEAELFDLRVSLADAKAFARMGLERTYLLTSLRFELQPGSGSMHSLRITSQRPITEPFLDFLVHFVWKNNQLVRQYTLLLDPPGYKPTPAASATVAPVKQIAQPARAPVAGDIYGPVKRNQTLSGIARSSPLSDQYSFYQVMVAIYRENPEAFLNNDINLLRAGSTLRIPSADTVASITRKAAVNFVLSPKREERSSTSKPRPAPQVTEPAEQTEAVVQTLPEKMPDDIPPVEEAVEQALEPAKTEAAGAPASGDVLEVKPPPADFVETDAGKPYPAELVPLLNRVTAEANKDLTALRNINNEFQNLAEVMDSQSKAIEQLNQQLAEKDQLIADLVKRLDSLEVVSAKGSAPFVQPVASDKPVVLESNAAIPADGEDTSLLHSSALWGTLLLLLLVGIVAWVFLLPRLRPREESSLESELEKAAIRPMSHPAEPAGGDSDVRGLVVEEDLPESEVSKLSFHDIPDMAEAEGEDLPAREAAAPAEVGEDAFGGGNLQRLYTELDILLAYHKYGDAEALVAKALDAHPEDPKLLLKQMEIFANKHDRKRFFATLEAIKGGVETRYPDIWAQLLELARELDPTYPLVADEIELDELDLASVQEPEEIEPPSESIDVDTLEMEQAVADLDAELQNLDRAEVEAGLEELRMPESFGDDYLTQENGDAALREEDDFHVTLDEIDEDELDLAIQDLNGLPDDEPEKKPEH